DVERLKANDKARREEVERQTLAQVEHIFWIANLAFPPGWLALGARGVAGSDFLLATPVFLGLTLIGTWSLWRSYRTTVRLYRGGVGARQKRAGAATPVASGPARPPRLLEARLPWLSEQSAAIALATFRGLQRAPEAKMMLLAPFLIV